MNTYNPLSGCFKKAAMPLYFAKRTEFCDDPIIEIFIRKMKTKSLLDYILFLELPRCLENEHWIKFWNAYISIQAMYIVPEEACIHS